MFPCLLAVLLLFHPKSGYGECKYHGLGQEQGLAGGFMLLKVPVCHLDCSLNLQQCKILASYKWHSILWQQAGRGRTDVGDVLAGSSL